MEAVNLMRVWALLARKKADRGRCCRSQSKACLQRCRNIGTKRSQGNNNIKPALDKSAKGRSSHRPKYPTITKTIKNTSRLSTQPICFSVISLPRQLIGPDITSMSRQSAQRLLIGPEISQVTLGVLMLAIVCHRISMPVVKHTRVVESSFHFDL